MNGATDRWAAGAAYQAYMGRWSQPLARAFLAWLRPEPSAHWLDVGCGTGSLTRALCEICRPASVTGCDPSEAFIEHARSAAPDARATFVVAGADALPSRAGGFDAIASGLVLNFIADPERALIAMRDRARKGGTVAAYVWDYSGGVEFLQAFWEAAVALDPGAAALDESRRFSTWTPAALTAHFRAAGLDGVQTGNLEIPTHFSDFNDYWQPFLGGTGPAPSYVGSLDEARRDQLRERLRERLRSETDGSIRLVARAHAVRGQNGA